MRIVFMGTPDFAVPCLQALLDHGYDVCGVFTQPDKPKGRGYTLTPPPVKELALRYNLPVYQPKSMKTGEAADILRSLVPDLAVVVAFGRILPREVLDIPRLGCINVHGSLLPKYRGAAPIQRAVLDGETETGVTTMFLADGVDTGDMIQKAVTPIGEEETSGELFDRLAAMGADLLISTVEALARGKVTREAQDHEQATHAAMIRKEEAEIDWTKSAADIHNLVRGMNPWPSAYTFYHGKRMKIHTCKVNSLCIEPGEIAEQNGEMLIGCGQGSILVEELQPENSRRMAGSAYLRGHHCQGEKLPS